MTNTDIFLKKYKELETIVMEKYDMSIEEFSSNSKLKFIEDNSYFLDTIRRLRNILTHYSDKNALCEVSNETIEKLDRVIDYIVSPPSIKNIYIPISKILYANENDLILPLFNMMKEKGFSHLPILNKSLNVIGVFDGNVMTSSILMNNKYEVKDDIRFSDALIRPFTILKNQYFNQYLFIKENSTIFDIEELFKKHSKDIKKISMLFVTKNGSEKEKLLGILTPNDILIKR